MRKNWTWMLLMVVPIIALALDSGTYTMSGTLGKKTVKMELKVNGANVTGTMVNEKNNKTFRLEGSLKPNGQVNMQAVNDNGQRVGTLFGELAPDRFVGTWKGAEEGNEVPVTLSGGPSGSGPSAAPPKDDNRPSASAPPAAPSRDVNRPPDGRWRSVPDDKNIWFMDIDQNHVVMVCYEGDIVKCSYDSSKGADVCGRLTINFVYYPDDQSLILRIPTSQKVLTLSFIRGTIVNSPQFVNGRWQILEAPNKDAIGNFIYFSDSGVFEMRNKDGSQDYVGTYSNGAPGCFNIITKGASISENVFCILDYSQSTSEVVFRWGPYASNCSTKMKKMRN